MREIIFNTKKEQIVTETKKTRKGLNNKELANDLSKTTDELTVIVYIRP